MRFPTAICLFFAFGLLVAAAPKREPEPESKVPKSDYAPKYFACPEDEPRVRDATSSVGRDESLYVRARRPLTQAAMLKFLTAAGVKGDFQKYFLNETLVPKTGIAFSGGGYRAMLVGAGIWRAMDSRTSENVFSGLLQGMDYMSRRRS